MNKNKELTDIHQILQLKAYIWDFPFELKKYLKKNKNLMLYFKQIF